MKRTADQLNSHSTKMRGRGSRRCVCVCVCECVCVCVCVCACALTNVFGQFERRLEEHTSELQSHLNLVCRPLLDKMKDSLLLSVFVSLSLHPRCSLQRRHCL